MTTFILTDYRGLVNLDSVVRIEPHGTTEIQFVTEEDLGNEAYHIGGGAQATVDFQSEADRDRAFRRLMARIVAGDRIIDPHASNPIGA